MNIKVLHLANDFSGSLVYKNLCKSLDKLSVEQVVYVAIRSKKLLNRNTVNFNVLNSNIVYSHILNVYTRINYYAKIERITDDIILKLNINNFDVIHAHTWYSDGGVAYELNKLFGIPYIVTVRGTDYNLFFSKLFYLRGYGKKILENAKQIIFVSPVYKNKLLENKYLEKIINFIESKCLLIPNGIDDFWVLNTANIKYKINYPLKLIYIGRFLRDKNIIKLIEAVNILNQKNICCYLNLVGGGGKHHNRILNFIKGNDKVIFHGIVKDKIKLKALLMGSDIFTMPSKRETFGIVYIEALSQGIPILYSKNEGIDGLYDVNIGEAVDCEDIDDIVNGIIKIFHNYEKYEFVPSEVVNNHNWGKIALKYFLIYKNILTLKTEY